MSAALGACSANGRPAGRREATPTTPLSAPAATTTTVPCTNRSVLSGWPLSARAAQLVAAPVLDADAAAMQEAAALRVGGVLLLGSVPPGATLAARVALSRPAGAFPAPLVMADEEGGGVQRLIPDVQSIPWPRQMASTMTPSALRSLAASVGAQMRALGVGADLAPVLDLDAGAGPSATNPDGQRSFSADPQTAASFGVAFMQGLRQSGVLAVVKHFPGLGGATGNTDYGPAATRPLASLEQQALLPFRQAFAAGAAAVMVANASVPGLSPGPASLSPAVITGLLRGQLRFGGLVMTDSLSAGAVADAGYGVPAAAVAAVRAGADMILFGSTLTSADVSELAPSRMAADVTAVVQAIRQAVENGSLSSARVDDAVGHVLAAKGVRLCP